MKRWLLWLTGFLFLCQACATIEKPKVETIPESNPQVSKTLTQAPMERFLKRKVAIARFSNETKYGQSFFLDKNEDWIGKQAMDILSARLSATEKFILLERADIEKINQELKLGNLAEMKIPADYLIVGSVSEFGRKTTSDVGVLSRTKKQTTYAKVNVRLVDIHTSRIVFSAEGDGEAFSEVGTVMGIGGRAGYDSTLNDKAISAAISKLVNNIVENLLEKPWRSYVLAFQDGQYLIAGGKSQGLRPGDVFDVYRKGKRVINPQTQIPVDLPGTRIGKIKVNDLAGSDSNNEISLCSEIGGTLPKEGFEEIFIQEEKQP